MHIWVWRLASSVGTQSHTTKVVVEDVVDILGVAGRPCNDIFDSDLERSARFFYNNHVLAKLPDH